MMADLLSHYPLSVGNYSLGIVPSKMEDDSGFEVCVGTLCTREIYCQLTAELNSWQWKLISRHSRCVS